MLLELGEMLKSDWVAVLPHVFKESEYHEFMFIVAWNKIEGKFAIPCQSRTAKRLRGGSQEQTGTPEPDGSHCLCHSASKPLAAEEPGLG